jgi:perosamine synthetase
MVTLGELAAEWGLPIVEDAAEAIGSRLHGRHLGTWGAGGVLSFNGNKLVTTGGGGVVLTDSPDLARRLKHLTTTAKLPHRWEFVHDEIAYNYRLPNLNAALGCAQLERLPDLLERKRRLAAAYLDAARGYDDLAVIAEPAGCRSNYWLNTVRLARCDELTRDAAIEMVNDAGF